MSGQGAPREPAPEPPIRDRVTGTTLWTLHHCERRLWLDAHGPQEAAPAGEFDELLKQKGLAHEREVLAGLPSPHAGPIHRAGRPIPESIAETRRLLRESRATLVQPALASDDGRRVGVPDFLYWAGEQPVIHDAKLAFHPDQHPEIALQLTHYRALLAGMGHPDAPIEITNGRGEELPIEPVPTAEYRRLVARAFELLGGAPEPDLLLAHSSCEACPYYEHCWSRAERERRIEILPGVTHPVAERLRAAGIATVDALAALAPDEIRGPGVRANAGTILAEARAVRAQRPVWLEGGPPLPGGRPIVWFDLEGVMDLSDTPLPIYLWGFAVDGGDGEPRAEAVIAESWPDDNRSAWERFVERAAAILARWPDAVWVHYHHYERTWVRKYAEAFGDDRGVAARLIDAMWDLHQHGVMRRVRLPLRSYSIKQVARHVGFEWSDPESGSLWSVVRFQEAMAAADPAERGRLLAAIARYNADDLRAMRAVWRWIERERPRG